MLTWHRVEVSAESGTLSESGLRHVLVVLCGTEIVSWGVLYYAFPVLAPSIATSTGWSISATTAAFSTGLVVSALSAPVGRWLDRVGPRPIMTTRSILAVPAVVGIALAPTLSWFFAAWILAGVAMAGTLYPPAFAALTRWWGPRRVTALTALTLLAGLASTIFAPLTAALLEQLQWRHTTWPSPPSSACSPFPRTCGACGAAGRTPRRGHVRRGGGRSDAVARSRAFLFLVAAVALGTFSAFAVVVNQVPLLIERGMSPAPPHGRSASAVWARSSAGSATAAWSLLPRFGCVACSSSC